MHIFTHLSASFPGPPVLTSLSDVKTRVMDVTLDDFAYLAHYLGYGWCGGCQGQWVGEDFVRSADSWHSNKIRNCGGYKSDHRLSLHYENFKFGVKDIKYGQAVIQVRYWKVPIFVAQFVGVNSGAWQPGCGECDILKNAQLKSLSKYFVTIQQNRA